jgi:hypothetical protein
MIASAQFEIPFTGFVTIYRGACGIDRQRAERGLSLTTDRSVASWFAHRSIWRGGQLRPLVVAATVPWSDIIYYSNEREEKEIVTRTAPTAWAEGDLSEWSVEAEALAAKLPGGDAGEVEDNEAVEITQADPLR